MATAITGLGAPIDPVMFNAALFNTGDGIVEVYTGKLLPITAIDRLKFTNPDTQTTNPPLSPGGPPDGYTAIRELDLTYDNTRGPGGKAFLTTPATCPKSRTWTSSLTFTTLNNPYPYHATSTTPCAHRAPKRKPRMRLAVTPRNVRVGKLVRVRFSVSSASRQCKHGATVRFAGKRATINAHGRATIPIRLQRPGRYLARATKPGCRPSRAAVHVR
jgi:hypothetical protein